MALEQNGLWTSLNLFKEIALVVLKSLFRRSKDLICTRHIVQDFTILTCSSLRIINCFSIACNAFLGRSVKKSERLLALNAGNSIVKRLSLRTVINILIVCLLLDTHQIGGIREIFLIVFLRNYVVNVRIVLSSFFRNHTLLNVNRVDLIKGLTFRALSVY